MNETHYYARVRALELALTLSGSHKYKMKKAEEFYLFLAQGIGIQNQPYYIYGNYSPTVPFTLTANQTITNGNQEDKTSTT